MLQIRIYKNTSEKLSFISQADPRHVTYIVPDLASKQIVQNIWLEKQGILEEDSVLRAQELWLKMIRNLGVDSQFVSSPLMVSILDTWLKSDENKNINIFPGTAQLLSKYIQIFLPILSSDLLTSNTIEWLKTNVAAFTRWGSWFFLSHKAWQHCIEKNTFNGMWSAGYLSSQQNSLEWTRPWIVDVNVQLKGIEIEIIKNISKSIDVTVMIPELKNGVDKVYQGLFDELAIPNSLEKIENTKHSAVQAVRLATELSEVKYTVNKIRELLDTGVDIHDIIVFAADIEHFWPCLHSHLELEGIPFEKKIVASLSTWPDVMRWLSALRISASNPQSGDLESLIFNKKSAPVMAYDEFYKLFSQIYSDQDISRNLDVEKLFNSLKSKKDQLSRDEFFVHAIKSWTGDSLPQEVERLLAQLLLECPHDLKWDFNTWLKYLEDMIAKSEFTIEKAENDGLFVTNLESAFFTSQKYIFILGACQNYLQMTSELSLTRSDMHALQQDLGVWLEGIDSYVNEWSSRWLVAQPDRQIYLTFSETDFSGEPLAPSSLWIENAILDKEKMHKVQIPTPTRWDELQNNIRNSLEHQNMAKYVNQDLGVSDIVNIPLTTEIVYSASQLEKYLKCPYVFAAEKLFRLKDWPVVDLDVDRMTRGRLVHEVLRAITEEPWRNDRSEQELLDLLDITYQQLNMADKVMPADTWLVRKQQYLVLLKKFIVFESEWRKKFPQTKTRFKELHFDSVWNICENKSIRVRGQMDRIDGDTDNNLVLLDYKYSGQFTNADSWLKNNQLQLLFYSLLIEDGVVPQVQGDVVGAFYFAISQLERNKGFRTDQSVHLLPENAGGKKSWNNEYKQNKWHEVKNFILEIITKIEGGVFSPNPLDKKDCLTCRWRLSCRAPHMNQ
jgi:ATP-dependent helicase/nuclease subunit B